jgi:hypothetical protein
MNPTEAERLRDDDTALGPPVTDEYAVRQTCKIPPP